jgi:hypothetical protein
MIKEIVVAAYDKDLSWMNLLNSDIKKTIYRKGTKLYDNEIFIEPNIGRCVHSFFNHIYINYDNLSDITFFVQDYPFDHWEDLIDVINNNKWEEKVTMKINGYYGFHYNSIGSMWSLPSTNQFISGNVLSCYSNGSPQDTNTNINVDKYWDILFDMNKPTIYEFIPGGHFGITKEQILLRSRNFYKKIVEILLEDVNTPWVIERLECYIFNKKFKTKC